MATMRAWRTRGDGVLAAADLDVPQPGPGEVLLRVLACGVCRTDLHVLNGEIPPHREWVVPGHEIVGEVVQLGPEVGGVAIGDRVGVPWLRRTCGTCRWCRSGSENLCESSSYTGWDADGGYAEYAVAPLAYSYPLAAELDPVAVAPLLCAGIIGYRALKRAAVPPAGRLGIYGFGASAHLTIQIALARGDEVHVVTRDQAARDLAMRMGATSAGGEGHRMPPLDSAIVFAPAGEVAAQALADLGPNGTVALAGIYLSQIPPLDYETQLFHEKTVTSVTSNTRADGAELMELAARLGIAAHVTAYPLDDAPTALADLAADRVNGVAVLSLA